MGSTRRLLPVVLAAHLLWAGFAGTFHVHTHGGDCADGHCEAPALPEASAKCACGHDHGPDESVAETEHQGHEHPPTRPHRHDDCSLCQFLATAWLPPAVVEFDSTHELVELAAVADVECPVTGPASLVLPRGPPRV